MSDDWIQQMLGEKFSPNQPRDEQGRFASGMGSLASQLPGAQPAKDIVSDAPKDLQDIIDKAYYVPTEFSGRTSHAAGTAARLHPDGSYSIPVKAGKKPSKGIIVHEATHGHQSKLLRENPEQHDSLDRRFEKAAHEDNQSVKNPLWDERMPGSEIWATATQFRYGGSPHLITDSSPKVGELLDEVYG